jgi:hypothetical protein
VVTRTCYAEVSEQLGRHIEDRREINRFTVDPQKQRADCFRRRNMFEGTNYDSLMLTAVHKIFSLLLTNLVSDCSTLSQK